MSTTKVQSPQVEYKNPGASSVTRTLYDRLNEAFISVKDFGAVGDGVADDTTAIQAAITAATVGNEITGVIYFPPGTYLLSSPILIGNGTTQSVALEIVGASIGYGSYLPNGPVTIRTNSSTNDLFTIKMGTNSAGLLMRGFTLRHPAAATGIALNFITNPANFVRIEDTCFYDNGIGIHVAAAAVSASFRHCDFFDNTTTGIKWSGGASTQAKFDSCYFQQSAGNAFHVVNGSNVSGVLFNSCVFQSNASDDFKIEGQLQIAHFDSCWWEAPGGSFMKITVGSIVDTTFTGCSFNGSNGVGGRTVLNLTAAAASGLYCTNTLFQGCSFSQLNAGYITYVPTDPTNANDPGFMGLTFIACDTGALTGDLIKGHHMYFSQPNHEVVLLNNTSLTGENVVNNGPFVRKPKLFCKSGKQNIFRSFADGDATPSVALGDFFAVANTGATNITMFDDGHLGQIITLIFQNANTTIVDGANVLTNGNFVGTSNDTMQLIFDGTSWYELSRSVN